MENNRSNEFTEKLRAFLEPKPVRIVLVLALIALVLVLPIVMAVHNSRYSAVMKINVVPSDARVIIGEQIAKAKDTVRLEPGEYTVVVMRMGFFSYAEKVTLSNGEEKTIAVALDSSDESTSGWYSDHPDDESVASGIKGQEVMDDAEAFAKKYPIINILPIIEDFYRIDYGSCDRSDDEFCIIITALTGARSRAANRLMGITGYDAAEYKIEYHTYIDPFADVSVSPNSSGITVYEENLDGARVLIDEVIAPLNAQGNDYRNVGVEMIEMDNSSYVIGKIEHHMFNDALNTYKVILQYTEEGWRMVAAPKLVYSYLDYPNLSREVIFEANH